MFLAGLLALLASCHGPRLNSLPTWLIFSTPDAPQALQQPDAGLVQIDLGQTVVGSTSKLKLSYFSPGGMITLGSLRSGATNGFSLPFAFGQVVTEDPSQIEVSFSPSSAGSRSAAFELTDSAASAPIVTFELSGQGIVPNLDVTPNPVEFGLVEVHTPRSISLTITNDGPVPEIVGVSELAGANAAVFSLQAPPTALLAPNGSTTLSVTFTPLEPFAVSGSFVVYGSPTTANVTVTLTGTGTQSWLQAVSPLDFGVVPVGSSLVKSAVIKNTSGDQTLYVIAPEPLVSQSGGAFGVSGLSLPMAIPPGQAVSVPVTFAPKIAGVATGILMLNADDVANPYPQVALEGSGVNPRIECTPQLAFGPVAVGYARGLTANCRSEQVPGQPLEIAQNDLRTGNPAFTASLVLPDGGPAGAGYGVALSSGESVPVIVFFTPPQAGTYGGRLVVPSSDPNELDAGTMLSGEGVVPGACDLQVLPGALGFGEVPAGDTGLTQIELDNLGDDYCVVTHVALDSRSDPAFSLPGGPAGYELLSFAANSDNPTGLPTSTRLGVQFAPTQDEALVLGAVDITVENAIPPSRTVPLTASSLPACLHIQPPSYDFGILGFSPSKHQPCVAAAPRSFVATNSCTEPVTVTRLAISSGLDKVAQFALDAGPVVPFTLDAGAEIAFEVGFEPTNTGPKVGAVMLTSDEFPKSPYLVTIEGDPELVPPQTDTFTVPPSSHQLDLLWVLDADDDGNQEWAVSAVIPQLVDAMNQAGIDYRFAVTTTDTCDAGASDQGAFEPCDHCLLSIAAPDSGGPAFVTAQTPDAGEALVDLMNVGVLQALSQGGVCEALNGDEHFFDSIAEAFSPSLLAGHNRGFLRPNANLAVVLVNGDSEDDATGNGGNPVYVTSLAQVTSELQSLKAIPGLVTVSYVNSGASALAASQKIGQLVKATGGIEIDTQEATAAWQAAFVALFQYTQHLGAFPLTLSPTSPLGIQVSVNGVLSYGWTYDATRNEIVFQPTNLPAPGSSVAVTYSAGGCR